MKYESECVEYKDQLIPDIYFEEMRTLQQDLTFESAQNAFKRYKVDFAEDKFIALGLRNLQND